MPLLQLTAEQNPSFSAVNTCGDRSTFNQYIHTRRSKWTMPGFTLKKGKKQVVIIKKINEKKNSVRNLERKTLPAVWWQLYFHCAMCFLFLTIHFVHSFVKFNINSALKLSKILHWIKAESLNLLSSHFTSNYDGEKIKVYNFNCFQVVQHPSSFGINKERKRKIQNEHALAHEIHISTICFKYRHHILYSCIHARKFRHKFTRSMFSLTWTLISL